MSTLQDKFTKNANEFDALMTEMLDKNALLRKALLDLVLIKRHKDSYGKDAWYLDHQPKAWIAAQKALIATARDQGTEDDG